MPTPEVPLITEHPDAPNFSESLQASTGVQPVQQNVKQVHDNSGQPMINTHESINAKIQIPSDKSTLIAKAKGSIADAATWLARFFLRAIKMGDNNANTDTN